MLAMVQSKHLKGLEKAQNLGAKHTFCMAGTTVSKGSRVGLSSGKLYIYIYDIFIHLHNYRPII